MSLARGEKKAVGDLLFKKDLKRTGGVVGAPTTNVVVRGGNKAGAVTKDRKCRKGSGVSSSESSDFSSESSSDDDDDEQDYEEEEDKEEERRR